jgi:hypothetical protein
MVYPKVAVQAYGSSVWMPSGQDPCLIALLEEFIYRIRRSKDPDFALETIPLQAVTQLKIPQKLLQLPLLGLLKAHALGNLRIPVVNRNFAVQKGNYLG